MRVTVLTLGCKANQAESAQIEAGFRAHGYSIVDLSEGPDLCIINTCSVTSKSDYQSRQLIRRAQRSEAKVVVTGCYSELNRDSVAAMDGVAEVLKNSDKFSIINEITGHPYDASLCYDLSGKSRFPLKVQDGCNNSCTYCIIPQARGRSRSVKIEDVAHLAEKISSLYNEIVLTGIHLGTYGYDLTPKVSLSYLLRVLLETKIKRIRLSSLEITEITEELLELLHDKRICNHLHIPLQSGDDKILRLMNRNYDVRSFFSSVERIVEKLPNASIGTDVIVGFPGEGEEEFMNTASALEASPITYFHVFPFSQRTGTKAAQMDGHVEHRIRKERCSVLLSMSNRKRRAFMTRQIGKTHDVLIEEEHNDGFFIGTTANYLKVRAVKGDETLKEIVNIKVAGHDGRFLFGVRI